MYGSCHIFGSLWEQPPLDLVFGWHAIEAIHEVFQTLVQRWWFEATKSVEDTVDVRNPAFQLRLVVYPIIYSVLYIPGGAGFLPSTVSLWIFLNC